MARYIYNGTQYQAPPLEDCLDPASWAMDLAESNMDELECKSDLMNLIDAPEESWIDAAANLRTQYKQQLRDDAFEIMQESAQ